MKAEIKTVRYRYLRDGRTGRTPTYTEWTLYINGEEILKRKAGQYFNTITQFEKACKEKYNLTEITRLKPYTVSLGFNAQAL